MEARSRSLGIGHMWSCQASDYVTGVAMENCSKNIHYDCLLICFLAKLEKFNETEMLRTGRPTLDFSSGPTRGANPIPGKKTG